MVLFHEIDLQKLKNYLIFLDIDGTLIHDDEHELDLLIIEKTKELQKENLVYLCSNSPNYERNRKVSELTGIHYLETHLRKPSKKILDLIDHSQFQKRLVIGDKVLTDGLFAKNIDADFIKVKRVTSPNDRPYIKFLYWIDEIASKFIKHENKTIGGL